MRACIFIIFLFLVSFGSNAQPAQYYFKHLGVENGLTNNQITAILKDSRGFLWIGTNSGLNRFDGYKVRTFFHDPRDSSSLPHNIVQNLFETPEGYIAVATPLGLSLFDPSSEKFSSNLSGFGKTYNISPGSLNTIVRDEKGKFWFVMRNSLLLFDPAKNISQRIAHVKSDTSSILPDSITHFATSVSGDPWLVHRNGVIERLAVSTAGIKVASRNYELYRKNRGKSFSYSITPDRDGDLWVTVLNDNQGVYLLSGRTGQVEQFTTSSREMRINTNIVGAVVEDNEGKIWVGTDHGGANVINKAQRSVEYVQAREGDQKSLPENSIKVMYRDREGIIWIGTYKRGVGYYHENIFRFSLYKRNALEPGSLPYSDVNRFVEDDKGNLWIGTNGGGLLYFDRKTGTYKQYRHNPSDPRSISADVIVSLCFDSKKRLWVGTYYGGLNMFDGERFVRYHNSSDVNSLPGRSVWEIFEDSKGNLWVGTLEGGLAILDPETGIFNRFKVGGPNAIQASYISAIMEDNKGSIWIGTVAGIDVYTPSTKTFIHYGAVPGEDGALSNENILDIHQDSQERVWVATSEGLNVFHPTTQTFQTFTPADGLPHTSILTIEEDANGEIWIGTPNGLSQLRVIDSGGKISIRCRTYTESDGLQGLQFNENASLVTRQGELVFGGPNGFNIFKVQQPDAFVSSRSVVFTDFQLSQRSVNIGERLNNDVILPKAIGMVGEIELPSDRNTFSVEVSALEFLYPEQIVYQYRMSGLNDEWNTMDDSRKVTFTSVNPGKYEFHVRAGDPESNVFGMESSLKITIPPPFWKSKTAFVLYAFFIAGVLFLARQLIQQREQLKFAIEQERQEAIRLHELDMMKIKFFTNVSHEFRTPITLILTPLEKLIKSSREQELRDQYQLIHRNAKRLLNLVNQLLDFRKLEVQEIRLTPSEGDIIAFIREVVTSFSDLSEKKSVALHFTTSVESLDTFFDQDKLEKILFNLLSNAFKFTPENGSVTVRLSNISRDGQTHLEVQVEDTGIGIAADKIDRIFDRFFQTDLPPSIINQGTGIGLSITKEFVKVHGGTITVSSTQGKGTVFTFTIPVKEIASPADVAVNTTASQTAMPELVALNDVSKGDEPIVTDKDKKHVLLLVEDNDDFRFYLKDNLKIHYAIVEAKNGQEGWQAVLDKHPDLIVSDVMMPVMNGIELCKKVKTDERASHIPVILLTARTSEDQKLEGFETGADDYITKPFNFELLESRIRNLIAQREKSQKVFRKTLDIKASELNITPLDTKLIEKAIKCVEENVSSPEFSVEDLGRELGISRAYLYKKLVALTGKSPLEFIRTIRLQHAAQLLEKSQLTVSEVAYRVGFNNPKYFARYFKEEYNILPSAYAASKKKADSSS